MKTRLLFFGLILMVWLGCKPEHQETPAPISIPCEEIPPSKSITDYEYRKVGLQYKTPVFFSGSSDEFIFKTVNYDAGRSDIERGYIKALISAPIRSHLGFIVGKPALSESAILFSDLGDGQLWSMAHNGDNLRRLTSYADPVYDPEFFEASGSQKLCCRYNGNVVANGVLLFLNTTGQALDTINYYDYGNFAWEHPDWSAANDIAFMYNDGKNIGLAVFDYTQKTLKKLWQKPYLYAGDLITSLAWHPGGKEIFFCNGFGIFKINVVTRQISLIRSGCSSAEYVSLDVSADGTALLCEKISRKKISETLIEEYSHIYHISINGVSEKLLF